MNRLSLKEKFQALSAEESKNIKGGWIKPLPPVGPIGGGGGGIGGTPPPVTSNSTNNGNGNGMNIIIP